MKFVSSPMTSNEKDTLKSLTRKHIAERQRRARINFLLEQLETLVLPQDVEPSPVKLEKAEVLEKTVNYIKRRRSNDSQGSKKDYVNGYKECLRKVFTFLDGSNLAPVQKNQIQAYLLSDQVSNEQSMDTQWPDQVQYHQRLYPSSNTTIATQHFTVDTEPNQCPIQASIAGTHQVSHEHIPVSHKHLPVSHIHLPVSPNTFVPSHNQIPASTCQLPVSPLCDGLAGFTSSTSESHVQIMSSRIYYSTNTFCEQGDGRMDDSAVWRPW